MAATPSGEYRDFVDRVVPLDQAQQRQDDAGGFSFEALAARITGSGGGGMSLFSGPCVLLGTAALAAALPSESAAADGFWRLGSNTTADLLRIGNSLAGPLALAAAVLTVMAIAAVLRVGQLAENLQAVQIPVSVVAGAGVGLIWIGFLTLAAANLVVLLFIITLYVIGTILAIAIGVGILIGLLSGGR